MEVFSMKYRFLLAMGVCSMAFTDVAAQELFPVANEKGKFGYVDANGNEVIKYKFTEAYNFESGQAIVKRKSKYGVIDEEGDFVGSIKYTKILPAVNGLYRVAVSGKYKDGALLKAKWGFMNMEGKEVIKPVYDEIGVFENGVTYVKKGNKYGVIDENGEYIVEDKYSAVGKFDEFGNCWIATGGKVDKKSGLIMNARYGVVNRHGDILIKPEYAHIGYFYRYKDSRGVVVDCNAETSEKYAEYSLTRPLTKLYNPDAYFVVESARLGEKGNIDSLRLACKSMTFLVDGKSFYFRKGKDRAGVIDMNGKIVVPEKKFEEVYQPSDGIAAIVEKKKKKFISGYYNTRSKRTKLYDIDKTALSFIDGMGKVVDKNDGSVYFVDSNGNKVTDLYKQALNFDDNLCIVQAMDGKCGVIDNTGKPVLPLEYDDMKHGFSEGLLGVCKNGKWGYADKSGNVVIPLEYSGLNNFAYGWAAAAKDGKYGIINKENAVVVPFEWDNIILPDNADAFAFWVKKDNLWYSYDYKNRKMMFDKGYDYGWNFKDDHAYVKLGEKYGMINKRGDIIIPCELINFSTLTNAEEYMKKTGKQVLNSTDVYRINVYSDASVNTFMITDVIPDSKWDY